MLNTTELQMNRCLKVKGQRGVNKKRKSGNHSSSSKCDADGCSLPSSAQPGCQLVVASAVDDAYELLTERDLILSFVATPGRV